MEFKILGTLEVTDGRLSRTPTAPKIRQVLAVLLVRANHFVSVDSLMYELWGELPPPSALTTIHTYVHILRKQFHKASTPTARLVTEQQGYVLQVHDEHLDATVFTRLAEQGGRLLERNRPGEAAQILRHALSLWRGPVASGVTAGRILQARAAHIEELRMQTIELWIQAEILLDRLRQIIPDLRSLVTSYPLNESLHAHLITALKQAGRRAEALDAYQRFRQVLDAELGLEPSQSLRQLQHALLVEDGPEPGGWRSRTTPHRHAAARPQGGTTGQALVARGADSVQ
jgi:DNA-binding SARP family transcriptional activator